MQMHVLDTLVKRNLVDQNKELIALIDIR